MRITVFGATGLLGKALMQEWKRGVPRVSPLLRDVGSLSPGSDVTPDQVVGLGSRDADIREPQQVDRAVAETQPDWIVLSAAYTDVDGCESNQQLAFDVNCKGAVNVARAAKAAGARLLTLSTDYVFDGAGTSPYEVDAPRAPRSVYGRSKADAEVEIQKIMPEACIARTAWLFGVGGKCFPDTILKLAASRPALDVVNDQRGSPTYSVDLARAIIQLCRKPAKGIVHVTNGDQCTWFEFAREIVAQSGHAAEVRPTTSDKFVRPAERPRYSVLSPRSLQAYGIAMPDWRDALTRYLQERSASN